jgi:hypothetical protein
MIINGENITVENVPKREKRNSEGTLELIIQYRIKKVQRMKIL